MFEFIIFYKNQAIISGLCNHIVDFFSNEDNDVQSSVQFYLNDKLVGEMSASSDNISDWRFELKRAVVKVPVSPVLTVA